jgi:hypothetical protein
MNEFAGFIHGPLNAKNVPPVGQPAGVGQKDAV